MTNIKEAFEEKTIYVVHSDADENNILQDFDDLSAALEYAKNNIDEFINSFSDNHQKNFQTFYHIICY